MTKIGDAAVESTDSDDKILVELAVNIDGQQDLTKIKQLLLKSKGVELVSSDLQAKSIQLELSGAGSAANNLQSLQRSIEQQTGIVTVIKGLGRINAAVAELRPTTSEPVASQVLGVVRLSQLNKNGHCFVDGALDRLANIKAARLSLAIYEYGDMSADAQVDSFGNKLIPIEDDLGAHRNDQGKVTITKIVPNCDIPSIIGRGLVLTAETDLKKQALSAGVIARSSIVDANKKQICTCSGKTLWEERIDRRNVEDA